MIVLPRKDFLVAALGLLFEVPERSASPESLLYAAPAPTVVPYQQQVSDAITIQSMRGVWQLREEFRGQPDAFVGKLYFRGAATEERGGVAYEGEAANGRGPWVIKPDGFGRSPTGVGGAIERKALWKLRRGASGTFTYAGRVNVAGYDNTGLADAAVDGDIVELINGGKPKGGSERIVGKFRATLLRRLTESEEAASTDSAAAGGAPESLVVQTLQDDRLVYR